MFYDYSICFDFESVLTKVEISNSEELRWSQRHDPISVSISSNVPGYTKENCIIDDDCDNLTENGSVFRKKLIIQNKNTMMMIQVLMKIWMTLTVVIHPLIKNVKKSLLNNLIPT